MRILPLLLAGVVVACASVSPDAAEGSMTKEAKNKVMRVLKKGTAGREASGEPGRRRGPWIEVASDKAAYEAIWNREIPGNPDTSIAFERETAVFLLLGPQQTGGYAIEPISVELGEGWIKVHAKLIQPMTEQAAIDVITAPFAVLAVASRGATKIEWIDADGRLLATKLTGE